MALFACAYFMRSHQGELKNELERFRGFLSAAQLHRGESSSVEHERATLAQLRGEWSGVFEDLRQILATETQTQVELNTKANEQLTSQAKRFGDSIEEEKREWNKLHAEYDEGLMYQKPVRYWENKAKKHRTTFIWLGAICVSAAGGVFYLLFTLMQETLRPPAGIADPSTWHPEYWRIAVLVAAGVFSVWVVRILVQLFLSNVHLFSDAKERTTMAYTYLSLLRRNAVKDADRQLILQALFRPTTTGVVKDDGVPLSVIESITRLGQGGGK